MKYSKYVKKSETTQGQKIFGSDQIQNSDGAYVFAVDMWKRLDRFLCLGSEKGSYYATEQKLTLENADNLVQCVKADGPRTVNRIVEVSDKGLAPKNDPALFALAVATVMGDDATRALAYAVLPKVARIGTHLFQFAEVRNALGGWGRGLRNAVSKWYTERSASDLAHQLAKYQQRNGWSHRDLLRLSHTSPADAVQNQLFRWAVKGEFEGQAPTPLIEGFEAAKKATSAKEVVALIEKYDLPRECIPTQFLTEAAVWEALLPKMPVTALVRNLGNMSKCGLIKPLSKAEAFVAERLADEAYLKKGRMHPLQVLVALNAYGGGRGVRGKGEWDVSQRVVAALDSAFYTTFQNVVPSNKRHLLAVDTSGSMQSGLCGGMTGINPNIGSACMAMVTVATEPAVHTIAFSDKARELKINKKMDLKSVIHEINRIGHYDTNVSAPMLYATKNKLEVDTFVIYTDSETNHRGALQPVAALQQYREKMGIPAKLVVVGMVANNFSVADPNDGGMLDVCGFSTDSPAVISGFSRGDF